MFKAQNVLDDVTPAIPPEVSPQSGPSGTALGETRRTFDEPDRAERGRSLLSRSADKLPRRSLFRR